MVHALREPLLERDDELELLRELIAGASAPAGVVALVEGPAGIGKSSLLAQAQAIGHEAGFQTATARASELEREFAFGLVRQLFEPLLSATTATQRERLFAGAAGLAAPLFENLDDDARPRSEASHAVLHGLYWLTVNLAAAGPIAVTVDDAHWADAPSMRFLAYLVNRVGDLRVFVAVGARPSEPGAEVEVLDELAASPSTRVIRPAPLSADAVADVVRAVLAVDPEPAFSAACFEATRGNPLLVRELLSTLAAEAIAPTAEQAAHVLDVAPRSVARSVARRLRSLTPEAGKVARAVAVLGDGTELSAAARLAGLDPPSAAAGAEALGRADILSRDALEFVHPVVRAAVYSELSPPQRAGEHRAAASILADQGAAEDQVALHVLAGDPGGDEWATAVLRRAARRARARGAPDIAATYLQRAISEPPRGDERVAVLVELALAELAAGRAAGLGPLREAHDLAEDPRTRAGIALQLGREVYKTGDLPEAAQVFEDALTELDGGEPDLAEQLEARLINVCLAVPSLRSRVVGRVIPLMMNNSRVSDPVLLAGLAMATTAAIPPAERGAELAERALAGGRLSAEEDPAVFVSAGIALMGAGRLDRAKSLWDQVIADARRRGSIPTLSLGWALRAFVLVRMGAIAAAEADAQGALERLDVELLFPLPLIVSPLIEVHLERGRPEAASELLEEHDLGGELPDLAPANFLLESVLGRLRIAQNRSSEGIAALRACGRRLEASGVRNPGLISWRSSLAPALAAAGERGQALALTREEVELARAFDVPRELGMALRAAGLVEGGAAGVDLLREAVAVLRASPARLEHARALTDLGAALRRKGQRSDAREPLRAGLDLAQRCGATALAHLAHGELVATGARPRRLVLSGVDALTASERRVAEMAADGLTNRQIAQALFVAEKTVQGHLGHAYRKLDITSRSELPDALQS